MERKKVTYYLDPNLAKGVRVVAAATARRDYQVVEDALLTYLERHGVQGVAEQVAHVFRPVDLHKEADQESALRVSRSAFAKASKVTGARERVV